MTPDPITTAREALDNLIAARKDFVAKRASMNAAIPALEATRAERGLYDERYKADHAAERELWTQAISFATLAADLDLAAQLEKLKAERDELEKSVSAHWTEIEHLNAATDGEITRLTSQLEQAERVIRAQEKALKLHHTWQGSDEPYGLELTPGNWIELNRGAEYADSSMYEVTMEGLRASSQWIKDRHEKQALSELHTEEKRLGLE